MPMDAEMILGETITGESPFKGEANSATVAKCEP